MNLKPVLSDLKVITYAIIMGEPLSVLAYGRTGRRNSSDIDILISKTSIRDVELLLKKHGFATKHYSKTDTIIMRAYSHQVSSRKKSWGAFGYLVVDLNYDIF